ncbi:MAG: homocysteine S-methyltransferase family protein [Nitratireductor sp.]
MRDVILLDGGMGQELIARSRFAPTPLWSTQILLDEPEIVEQVHRDYIEAGARVITINAYSATPERLERDGDPARFRPLQQRAIDLACAAREAMGREVAIAGCLPPLVAGYRPELTSDFDLALATYRRIAGIQGPRVDLILCETLSSTLEIAAATRAAAETGRPVWTAVSLMDGAPSAMLRSGEPLAAGLEVARTEGAQAVLANCCRPETISAAQTELAAAGLPFGAYANGFSAIDALRPGGTVDALTARTDLNPQAYARWALDLVAQGATIVGGCCEIGPDHICELKRQLEHTGHTITGPFHA